MLYIRGWGMLLNAVYLYWIIQVALSLNFEDLGLQPLSHTDTESDFDGRSSIITKKRYKQVS